MDQKKNPPFTQEDQLQSRCQTDCLGRRDFFFSAARFMAASVGCFGIRGILGALRRLVSSKIVSSTTNVFLLASSKIFVCGCSILLVEEMLHHMAFF